MNTIYVLSELDDTCTKVNIGAITSIKLAQKFMDNNPAERYAKELLVDDPELLNRIAEEGEIK